MDGRAEVLTCLLWRCVQRCQFSSRIHTCRVHAYAHCCRISNVSTRVWLADLLTLAHDPENAINHSLNPRKVLTSNMTELPKCLLDQKKANKMLSGVTWLIWAACLRIWITLLFLWCHGAKLVSLNIYHQLFSTVSLCVCVFFYSCSHVCTMNNAGMHVWACVCVLYVGRMLLRERPEFFMGV